MKRPDGFGYAARPMKKILRSALVARRWGRSGSAPATGDSLRAASARPSAPETDPPGRDPRRRGLRRPCPKRFGTRTPSRAREGSARCSRPSAPRWFRPCEQTLEDRTVDLDVVAIDLLVRFWATHQPDEAARWAKEKSPRPIRQDALYAAIYTWASQDPQAAASATWDWVEITDNELAVTTGLIARLVHHEGPRGHQEVPAQPPPGIPQPTRDHHLRPPDGPDAGSRGAPDLGRVAPRRRAGLQADRVPPVGAHAGQHDEAGKAAAMSWCEAHCETPSARPCAA